MPDRTFRDLADAHVTAHAELDPLLATELGLPTGQDRLPDLSPTGDAALDALERDTLAALAAALAAALDAAGAPGSCASG